MLDIKQIRENTNVIAAALARRGQGAPADTIQQILALDDQRRDLLQKQEELNRKRNELAEQMKGGKPSDDLIRAGATLKTESKSVSVDLENILPAYEKLLHSLPNVPLDDVPDGGEGDYEIVAEGKTPKPTGDLKDYITLLGRNIDLDRAAKVSGSRFVYFTGTLARLEIAVVAYIFDQLAKHSFIPVMPPVMIKEPAMAAMGYLDHARDEVYVTQDNLHLVGTSEQSIGPMHMNEILEVDKLPLRYVGYSSCFRRESGSHGKDVKGIIRMHQFQKIEMFSFTTPEQSQAEHEFLLERQREIMDALELPYRVIKLAAGDLGAPSAKTYDIETWIPSEGKYRETHSTSNTTDFQARRLKIRVKTEQGNVFAHMLNGTAVAWSRIPIALIENHQRPDGTIAIPAALYPYLPFTTL